MILCCVASGIAHIRRRWQTSTEQWQNNDQQGKTEETRRRTKSNATSSTANQALSRQESNMGFRVEKPVIDRQRETLSILGTKTQTNHMNTVWRQNAVLLMLDPAVLLRFEKLIWHLKRRCRVMDSSRRQYKHVHLCTSVTGTCNAQRGWINRGYHQPYEVSHNATQNSLLRLCEGIRS